MWPRLWAMVICRQNRAHRLQKLAGAAGGAEDLCGGAHPLHLHREELFDPSNAVGRGVSHVSMGLVQELEASQRAIRVLEQAPLSL